MHIKRNSDFTAIYAQGLEMAQAVPAEVWNGQVDAQYSTIHRILEAVSGGEYDTAVILNEAHELTNIINNMRNTGRDNSYKRAVQAETQQMTIARLLVIGLYTFYDSTFVAELHPVDRNRYIHAVRAMMANYAAGMITRVGSREDCVGIPTWSFVRTQIGRYSRMFYPSLHTNSPWSHFKMFIAVEGNDLFERAAVWNDDTIYMKALIFTRVYEYFDRVDLISKDTVIQVTAAVFRDERQALLDCLEATA